MKQMIRRLFQRDSILYLDQPATVLRRAGWTPTRQYGDLDRAVAQLAADGHPVFPAVRQFLASYGGLRLTYRYILAGFAAHRGSKYLDFDVAPLSYDYDPDWRQDIETVIGVPLCLVGMWQGEYMELVMSPDGAIYGLYGEVILRCGATGDAAVWNMLSETNLERLRG